MGDQKRCSPGTRAIITLVCMAIPIAMIVMGVVNMDKCPAERMIPIYLIVGGSFGILLNITQFFVECYRDDGGCLFFTAAGISLIAGLFSFAWFIAGNVWIYRLHNKNSDNPEDVNYCENSFYMFAFWMVTSTYILLGASIVVGCCCRSRFSS